MPRLAAQRPRRVNFRPQLLSLEDRVTPAAPVAPVIIEPFSEGQITGTFDINMQTDPGQYFDPDGHAWQATEWRIRDTATSSVVWQTGFLSAPPLTLYRVDFSDGVFVGALAGRTELNYSTNYQLLVRYRDSNSEVSVDAIRNFTTAGATQPVPGAGTWLVRPGYVVEPVHTGLRLPVNIAFVPNAGTNPSDPLYYVAELYGSIRVVRRDGTMQTFASGLLDYNPQGPISGSGEQGLTGLAVERDSGNPNVYHLYVGMLWDNGSPPAAPNHYPKVERLTSTTGGLTMASRTLLLNMQPETQGQSHQISNITIGPDNKLYVHVGDGFDSSTALNLDMYRGKVLRMNKNGSPVATSDPAGANPFYNAANGINARDYVFTYGHRNPFGGAWRPGTNRHWIVENGNNLDRMVDLVSGTSYGWNGNDSTLVANSKFVWNPSTAPVNIDFVAASVQGGSGFPTEAFGHAFVTLSGSTYAAGPLQRSKAIVEFPDLDTLGGDGKLLVQPSFLVKYNGTGRASVAGLAAGPDGLYFTDLYEDTGSGGATGAGANIYRVRYVGNAGGQLPTVATPAAANPNPIILGSNAQVSVLGADDGGEASLTYTWGVQGNPPAPVGFSINGTNAAKNAVASFTANGTYNLYVAIRDVGGQTAISNVTVNITSIFTDTGNGVTGQYWNNIDFTGTTSTRTDPTINFNWGAGAPVTGLGADTFSARWTGWVVPRFTETYTFWTTSDDGNRLWVNNLSTPLIDAWFDQSATVSHQGQIALTAGTPYQIRMDFYENGGNASVRLEWSSPSQPRQIVPQGRLYTALPSAPAAPTMHVPTSPSSTQINLSWTDNASNEQGYRIERGTDGTNYTLIATTAANATGFNDTGLSPGATYFYRVRAVNPGGQSSFGSATLPTRPAAPLNLGAMGGIGQVTLNWLPSFGATFYNVYRATAPGGQGAVPLVSGLTSPTFLDSTVTNGVTYYYKVSAVNLGGESVLSAEASATPLAANPPSVESIAINNGADQRSIVTNLRVAFSTLVHLAPGAFVLTDLAGVVVPNVTLSIKETIVGGKTVAIISFSGPTVIANSLADGRYRLRVVAGNVSNQTAPNSPMAADATHEFHRMFGDINGDVRVDGGDFVAFVSTYNLSAGNVGYLTGFDVNGDGRVDGQDLGAFVLRFNTMLP